MDKDYLKEKIAYYKLWITILTTIDASIIAWFFKNYGVMSGFKFISIELLILIATLMIFILNAKTKKFLERIGDKNGN